MRELFIYYRVHTNRATALRAAVCDWHRRLQQRHPELIVRLLHRDETPIDTWMETYRTDPTVAAQGIGPELQARIEHEAQALAPLIDGTRHTEVFRACAS